MVYSVRHVFLITSIHKCCNVLFYRWMDGVFLELNSEVIEGEVDEYARDMYKIQRVFNAKVKKLMIEKEERDREKKKRRRLTEDDGSDAVQEEEEELQTPRAVNVCSAILDNMKDFKVRCCFDKINLPINFSGVLCLMN